MIQIDDAGSGSLIGGTCIGVYNTETEEYIHDIIPLELYKLDKIKQKLYLDYVINIVENAFIKMNLKKPFSIEVCRGYMFEKLRNWLCENNYDWNNSVITGTLQEKVEKSFEDYAISLGFPYQYIKYTKYPFHFHRILKWVYADYDNRSKLCKTGWSSWQKYGTLPLEVSIDYIESENTYHCLKCGRKLNPNRKVKILKYESNRTTTIYVHRKCNGKLNQ